MPCTQITQYNQLVHPANASNISNPSPPNIKNVESATKGALDILRTSMFLPLLDCQKMVALHINAKCEWTFSVHCTDGLTTLASQLIKKAYQMFLQLFHYSLIWP